MRNKYLEDLGIKPIIEKTRYNIVDFFKNIPKAFHYFKQRRTYGFDSRECFNLNDTFVEWLYSHIKMYLEDADKIIVLDETEDYCCFFLDGEKYTQRQAIEYILKRCEDYLTVDKYLENIDFQNIDNIPNTLKDISQEQKANFDLYNQKEYEAYTGMRDAVRMWAELFPAMWW